MGECPEHAQDNRVSTFDASNRGRDTHRVRRRLFLLGVFGAGNLEWRNRWQVIHSNAFGISIHHKIGCPVQLRLD